MLLTTFAVKTVAFDGPSVCVVARLSVSVKTFATGDPRRWSEIFSIAVQCFPDA